MEATGSPETTNVVISYLNKPPLSKPLPHFGISYVIVERCGVQEPFMNARCVPEFAKKVIFNIGHSVAVTDMCV